MSDTGKIARNLERFAQAVAAHDRENPTHTAYGIGVSHFDLERLGLEEGEQILPGITIEVDGGVTGNFRVLSAMATTRSRPSRPRKRSWTRSPRMRVPVYPPGRSPFEEN